MWRKGDQSDLCTSGIAVLLNPLYHSTVHLSASSCVLLCAYRTQRTVVPLGRPWTWNPTLCGNFLRDVPSRVLARSISSFTTARVSAGQQEGREGVQGSLEDSPTTQE